jgi:hypothetical protein
MMQTRGDRNGRHDEAAQMMESAKPLGRPYRVVCQKRKWLCYATSPSPSCLRKAQWQSPGRFVLPKDCSAGWGSQRGIEPADHRIRDKSNCTACVSSANPTQ